MNKEEQSFIKRLSDLSNLANQRGIFMFSDFLSMNEQSILHNHKKALGYYELFGGYAFAERQMAVFVPDAPFYTFKPQYGKDALEKEETYPYPIAVLHVAAKYPKFAEKLSHRDYLGAFMNLGVERGKIGDILVKENTAYVFCHEKLAQYFIEELTTVRRTQVEASRSETPTEMIKPEFAKIRGSVSSLRADSIAALAAGQSRTRILELFKSQKIFVNGRLIESGSVMLKEGDVLTIRGIGRFIFKEIVSMTKKERYAILLLKNI